jgi:hypothetical protein
MSPGAHVQAEIPPEVLHVACPTHAVLQFPQCALLVVKSTQPVPEQ